MREASKLKYNELAEEIYNAKPLNTHQGLAMHYIVLLLMLIAHTLIFDD